MSYLTCNLFFATLILSLFMMLLESLVGNVFAISYDERVKFSPPKLTQNFAPIGQVTVGQQVTIETTITHSIGDSWDLVVYFEVRNVGGMTEFLAWQSGVLSAGSQKEIGVSWIPEDDGSYQIRVFAFTNDWEQPQALSNVYSSEIMINPISYSIRESLLALTEDKLLSLREGAVKYERPLNTLYSEIAWDGNNLYLAEFQQPGTDTAFNVSSILVLDQHLSEIRYLEISQPIYDFAAKNGTMYVLAGDRLRLIDVEDRDNPKAGAKTSIAFSKPNHDIMLRGDRVYLLDNIAHPLYIHIVELPSLTLHTKEFTGVNAHLAAQDVLGDKWYVLESVAVLSGYFENLFAFSSDPEKLNLDPGAYRLVVTDIESPPERIHMIKSIHVEDENTLFALGSSLSLGEQPDNELTFMVYTIDGEAEQLAALELGEKVNPDQYPYTTNIVLIDDMVYVGGQNGIYVINIDDLTKPFIARVLPTESPVRYLLPIG